MEERLIEYDLPLANMAEALARGKNICHGRPCTLRFWRAGRDLPLLEALT
jgi:hypothetical protein